MLRRSRLFYPVVLGLAVMLTLSLSLGCATAHKREVKEDVCADSIRHLVEEWLKPLSEETRQADHNKEGHVYLSFGAGPDSDPPPRFMQRFAGDSLIEVRSKSMYRSDGIVVNPATGWPGFIIQIDKAVIHNQTLATVFLTVINWEHYSTGHRYELELRDGKWVVVKKAVLWNTRPEERWYKCR